MKQIDFKNIDFKNIDLVQLQYILIGIMAVCVFLAVIFILFSSPKGEKKKKGGYDFILKMKNKTLHFFNPFANFLVYGGANSGKTKSLGKPLLREFIRHGFAAFIYDYKDEDLTRTAKYLCKKYNISLSFYQINFADIKKSHRVNPISPSVIKDEALFLQCMDDFVNNYASGDKNEWYQGAKGIFKGVAIRFYRDYPQYCTIPHIVNLISLVSDTDLVKFLKADSDSHKQASAFVGAESSERTLASYKSTINNFIADLSINKKICYVLTGNDFDFNLIDPNDPKIVCFSNSYQIENIISPIIGLMVTLSARQFTLKNKVPFVYILDEATTFKIADFEKMPSVLREYLCAFVLLTQSPSKIEKLYQKHDRASLEANFGNQFFGRTKERLAIETFTYLLGKEDREIVSRSKGRSRGGESQGTTVSSRLENRYDVDFFMDLKPGEFIGSATQANTKRFFDRFEMYAENEKDVELHVDSITNSDVELNYIKITEDIKNVLKNYQ